MKICDIPWLVAPEIHLAVRPVLPPSRVHQNNRAIRNSPVAFFPGSDVAHGEEIVTVFRAIRADVDHNGRRDQTPKRYRLRGQLPFREVDRTVYVSALMFASAETAGTIKETAGRR